MQTNEINAGDVEPEITETTINPYVQKVIPQILYHGTNAQFENFDKSFLGTNTGYENTVHGFFFTDLLSHAEMFGSRIIAVSLEIKKPLDLTIEGIFSRPEQASVIWEAISGEGLDSKDALDMLNEEIGLGEIAEMFVCLHSIDANTLFIESGYDGIVSSLGDGYLEYAAFDVEQITLI